MKKRSLLSLVLSLALSLSVSSFTVSAETVEQDGMSVTLSTDKEQYSDTDSITANLQVTNSNEGSVYDVTLDNAVPKGYTVAEESDKSKTVAELKAGESIKLETIFVKSKNDSSEDSKDGNDGNNTSRNDIDGNSSKTNSGNGSNSIAPTASNPVADDSNPQTGIGYSLYGIVALLAAAVIFTKRGKGKQFFCLVLSGTMLLTIVPSSDLKASAVDSKNISVSTDVKVDGTALSISSAVAFSFTQSEKQYDENNVGEIYFEPTAEEHIATSEDGVTMYADNEVLVVAKSGVSKTEVMTLAASYGAEVVGYIEQTGDYQWKFDGVKTDLEFASIVTELESNELVAEVDKNYIFPMYSDTIPGIDYIDKEQKHLIAPIMNRGMYGHRMINAPFAWEFLDLLPSAEPIKIGLIDNAFYKHEDLGFAEIFYDSKPTGEDVQTKIHGTHVAGTMAANGDNAKGICGVYPYGNGRLYGVSSNGLSAHPENPSYKTSSMTTKVEYAELIFRNVKVINQSEGFNLKNWYNNLEDSDVKKEIGSVEGMFDWALSNESYQKSASELASFLNRTLLLGYDYIIVTSAGNDYHQSAKANSWLTLINEAEYEDVYNRIVVVGMVGTLFSDYDVNDMSNVGERVDIYAPGFMIYSTKFTDSYGGDGALDEMSGTSMSSPHVAGVAADVWTANNNLSGAQVKQIIKESILDDSKSEYPVIDAAKAVIKAVKTEGDGNSYSTYGAVMGWVVDSSNLDSDGNPEKLSDVFIQVYKSGESTPIQLENGESGILTDSNGHFELLLPAGKYDIRANHTDYGENTIANIEVFSNQVTYCEWLVLNKKFTDGIIKLPGKQPEHSTSGNTDKLTETDLKTAVEKDSDGRIGAWAYADYDKDGNKEAFAVVTEKKKDNTTGSYKVMAVYFVNHKGETKLMDDSLDWMLYEDSNERYLEAKKQGFFNANMGAHGSGFITILYSVKNGQPYELNLSQQIQGFYKDDKGFYTTENDFSSGHHEYPEVELIYDSIEKEFYKGDRRVDSSVNNIQIPTDALEWNGHYYACYDNCSTWEEAKEYCESLGGHLATITSLEENSAVYNYLIECGYQSGYFGYTESEAEGTWKWVNNESSDYTNWHENEPNSENANEDYAMFYYKYTNGEWNDGDFGVSTVGGDTAFICEWDYKPDKYWVVFYEGFRNNRLEMSTFNAEDDCKIIWNTNLKCGEQDGKCQQFYLNEDNEWIKIGTYHILSDYAVDIVASNVDIYDNNGLLLVKKSDFNDYDFTKYKEYNNNK